MGSSRLGGNPIMFKIKTNITLLPFGSINYILKGHTLPSSKKHREMPIYHVPITTDIESLELDFVDETDLVPPVNQEELE